LKPILLFLYQLFYI
jgi:hypothetical protein